MDLLTRQLLDYLREDKAITAAQLAVLLNVSERTVRTRLGDLGRDLERHGARLVARRRVGYSLAIEDPDAFDAWQENENVRGDSIPGTSAERVQFILLYLLRHDDYVKLDELSESLYISRTTVTADLKQAEKILEKYHLTIERRPNYGIRLTGSEFDRRICIAKQFAFNDAAARDELARLRTLLFDVTKRLSFHMADNALEAMAVHLYIANGRQQRGHSMSYPPAARAELEKNLSPDALTTAKCLVEELGKHTEVPCNEDEILYLAIHLSGKTISGTSSGTDEDERISNQMDELITRMLEAVYEGHRLDFRGDAELRKALKQHMIPLHTRLRFNIPLTNPILDHIKVQYSLAFVVASTACTVLQEYYGRVIPQDETGYIAILFGLAIEKRERSTRKRNIVVVCASGRGTSQMFLYKCKQAFAEYIDQIYEKTVYELPEMDFTGLAIDCIFTTIPLEMDLPVPVYQVSPFLDNQEIETYERIFARDDTDFLSDYFDARLFLPRLKGTSKEEVLKQMCDYAAQFKALPQDFYALVMKREEMGQTDFGNLVAIPHPCKVVSEEPFVVTAILDKPIWWGHNEVQTVFLISLPKADKGSVESFYRAMLNFQADKALVKSVIKEPTFTNLMQAFREASLR